jgi:hypothetical protein
MRAEDRPGHIDYRWRAYCDRVFCDLRGYLIGTQ